MDLATGIGLVGGVGVVFTLIMIDGGNFAAYFDKHAVIVIFGGAGVVAYVAAVIGARSVSIAAVMSPIVVSSTTSVVSGSVAGARTGSSCANAAVVSARGRASAANRLSMRRLCRIFSAAAACRG